MRCQILLSVGSTMGAWKLRVAMLVVMVVCLGCSGSGGIAPDVELEVHISEDIITDGYVAGDGGVKISWVKHGRVVGRCSYEHVPVQLPVGGLRIIDGGDGSVILARGVFGWNRFVIRPGQTVSASGVVVKNVTARSDVHHEVSVVVTVLDETGVDGSDSECMGPGYGSVEVELIVNHYDIRCLQARVWGDWPVVIEVDCVGGVVGQLLSDIVLDMVDDVFVIKTPAGDHVVGSEMLTLFASIGDGNTCVRKWPGLDSVLRIDIEQRKVAP